MLWCQRSARAQRYFHRSCWAQAMWYACSAVVVGMDGIMLRARSGVHLQEGVRLGVTLTSRR